MQTLHDHYARILADYIADNWDDFVQYLGERGEPEYEAEEILDLLNEIADADL